MKKISTRHLKEWGPYLQKSMEFLSNQLCQRGFSGPANLTEKCFFSFRTDACESIQITLGFSQFSQDSFSEIGIFDSSIVVRSKTLYLKTISTDPWSSASRDSDNHGYEPCYVDRLAHRKWRQQPGATNPSWLMTTDPSFPSNLHDWLIDFDQLHMPHIRELGSDSALISEMHAALNYRKPAWVKSDGPRFVGMRERLAVLEERP